MITKWLKPNNGKLSFRECTYEESEQRLIVYQIAIGMSMQLAILAIFISIPIITMESKPRVAIPSIVDYNQYGEYHQIF